MANPAASTVIRYDSMDHCELPGQARCTMVGREPTDACHCPFHNRYCWVMSTDIGGNLDYYSEGYGSINRAANECN